VSHEPETYPVPADWAARAHIDRAGYEVQELALCPSDLGWPNQRLRFYLVAGRGLRPFPPKVWRHVALPLAWRSILGGALMGWARALGEFGATIIVAGNLPGRTQTMPLAIYVGFEMDQGIALIVGQRYKAASLSGIKPPQRHFRLEELLNAPRAHPAPETTISHPNPPRPCRHRGPANRTRETTRNQGQLRRRPDR